MNHIVKVLNPKSVSKSLAKPDLAGRMIRWFVELSEFHIHYQSREAIKSQVLAEFTIEFSPLQNQEDNFPWILHVDSSSNSRSCGAGVVLEGPGNILIEQALKFEITTSNNQASGLISQ